MALVSDMLNTNRINLADAIPLPAPLVIQAEPSGFCNLKCVFCPVNDVNVQKYLKKDTMTLLTFKKMVDQCADFPQAVKILRLIGAGEPLLNKNLPEMIVYAKQSKAFEKIEITTNGTLLNPDVSTSLIESGLDILKVSLEATDDERFNEISGVRLRVDEIKENIKFFYRNRKDCLVYIKTSDAAVRNEAEKQFFFKEYDDICDYIFVENVVQIWPEYDVKTAQADKTRYGRSEKIEKPVCVQPFKLLSITADGEVFPCCADWKRQLSLGNINDISLMEMWNGNKLLRLRLSLLKNNAVTPCSVCDFQRVSQNDNIDSEKEKIIVRLGN